MKKVIYSMIVMLGIAAFMACSDDNSKEIEWQSPIKIINSNILFEGTPSTGGLRVAAPGPISASTTAAWCRLEVTADSVTVSVDENREITGRTAVINIKSGGSEINAVVQQKGLAFLTTSLDDTLSMPSTAARAAYFIKHTSEVKTWTNASWVNSAMESDSLIINAVENDGRAFRSAVVYIQSGPYTDSLVVSQAFSFDKAYLGTYSLRYESGGKQYGTPVEMVKDEEGRYSLVFTSAASTWSGLSLPIDVDDVNMQIYISNLSIMGQKESKGTNYYVISLLMGAKKGTTSIYRFNNSGIKIIGSPNVSDEGVLTWDFVPNDKFDFNTYTFYGLRLGLSTNGTYAGYKSAWITLPNPKLVKE
ncbi:MAG: BACON domain-containing protein [Prevotella sp.]|nr:BACON domain-containing protein [Prevotella sp.]MDY4039887.1 BACON domain-containing protein [Prevotella sp.]